VPKYCTQSCRQRAYELRTAEARRDRDAAAGLLREEPVRELVERTETVTRTVVRQGLPWENGTALRAPHTTAEWCQMLAHLAKRIPDMRFNNDPDRPELDAAIRHLHAVLEANPAINLPPRQAPPQLSEANDYALQEPVKVRPAQSDAAEAKPEAAPVTPSRGTENRH
jgi:hypothetical protein